MERFLDWNMLHARAEGCKSLKDFHSKWALIGTTTIDKVVVKHANSLQHQGAVLMLTNKNSLGGKHISKWWLKKYPLDKILKICMHQIVSHFFQNITGLISLQRKKNHTATNLFHLCMRKMVKTLETWKFFEQLSSFRLYLQHIWGYTQNTSNCFDKGTYTHLWMVGAQTMVLLSKS